MAVKDNLNSNTSYVSCVVIKGRPILPPVMTSQISAEMLRFKEMALEVEKRIRKKKIGNNVIHGNGTHLKVWFSDQPLETKSDGVENAIVGSVTFHQSNVVDEYELKHSSANSLSSNKCSPNFNMLNCDASTPPSVASTDLAKYMTASSDKDDHSVLLELDSSVASNLEYFTGNVSDASSLKIPLSSKSSYLSSVDSSSSTVIPDDNHGQLSKSLIRRNSYTLESPSPALIAKMQEIELEDDKDEILQQVPNIYSDHSDVNNQHFDPDDFLTNNTSELMMRRCLAMQYFQKVDVHPSGLGNNSLNLSGNDNNTTSREFLENTVENHRFEFYSEKQPKQSGRQEIQQLLIPPSKLKFDRLSAAVKGYLTRRLMRTNKVQSIIMTIKDTLEFAVQLRLEIPLQKHRVSFQDAELHKRVFMQLTAACCEFHDIFFKLTTKERMEIISHDRQLTKCVQTSQQKQKNLSSATMKSIERKRYSESARSSPRTLPPFKKGSVRERKRVYRDCLHRRNGCGGVNRARTASPVLQRAFERCSNEAHLFAPRHHRGNGEQLVLKSKTSKLHSRVQDSR